MDKMNHENISKGQQFQNTIGNNQININQRKLKEQEYRKRQEQLKQQEYLKRQEYLRRQAWLEKQKISQVESENNYNTQARLQNRKQVVRNKQVENEKYSRSQPGQKLSTNTKYTEHYSNFSNSSSIKGEQREMKENVYRTQNSKNTSRNNTRNQSINSSSNSRKNQGSSRNPNSVKERNTSRNDYERSDFSQTSRQNIAKNRYDTVERKKGKKQKNKGCISKIAIILLILLLCCSAAGYVIYQQKYGLSNKVMSLNKYYEVNSPDDLAIVLNNKRVESNGILKNNKPYIEYQFLQKNINSRFYWDSEEQKILYTLQDRTIDAGLDSVYYTDSDTQHTMEAPAVVSNNEKIYIALEYIKLFSNMEYTYYNDPGRVVIRSVWDENVIANIKEDTQIRYRGGVKSDILTEIKKNNTVTVLEAGDSWSNVATEDGIIGYVQNKKLGTSRTESISREFEEQVYTNLKVEHPINLAFHQVTSMAGNNQLESVIGNTKQVTTIAPTWFFIDNKKGDITSLASESYVEKAHELGMDVWAVLNDIDGKISSHADTLEVLKSSESRRNLISQVMKAAIKSNVDGINVDIENVSTEAGEHYLQFLRELSVECRKEQLVLSVDNYPPKAYNQHFDYKEQGIVVDYVVIMGYDEHYSQSKEEGPVASIGYVEEAINEMLTMVTPEKIINAIPFYSRLWKVTPKTSEELAQEEGTEDANYSNKVSSQTYGIDNAKKVVREAGATVTWDPVAKSNYATWEKDNATYRIWLEDEESVEEKLKVVKANNLAGVAFWKLTFDSNEVWDTIEEYLKN